MVEFNTPYELAVERAERQAMYEAILRASRAAYHEEQEYRRQVMLEAVQCSHPSTRLTQVYVSGRTPGEDSWGVASVWPQPGVPSGDAGGSRNMGGAGVDPAPDSPGVHGDHRGDEARRPAAAPRWQLIGGRSLGKLDALRQFEAAHQLALMLGIEAERQQAHRRVMRGASPSGVWLDEAVTWKTGRSIESYMDEVIQEVMGCDER